MLRIFDEYIIVFGQEGGIVMITYIIEDLNIIKLITGKENYRKILLHINHDNKTARYESDYTLFELTETLNYN